MQYLHTTVPIERHENAMYIGYSVEDTIITEAVVGFYH